jgi:hypothetical protein
MSDHPVVLLHFSEPGSVEATPSRSDTITTQLQDPETESTVRGRGRAWTASSGDQLVLSVAATEPWLRLGVPPDGTTTLCHVAP